MVVMYRIELTSLFFNWQNYEKLVHIIFKIPNELFSQWYVNRVLFSSKNFGKIMLGALFWVLNHDLGANWQTVKVVSWAVLWF